MLSGFKPQSKRALHSFSRNMSDARGIPPTQTQTHSCIQSRRFPSAIIILHLYVCALVQREEMFGQDLSSGLRRLSVTLSASQISSPCPATCRESSQHCDVNILRCCFQGQITIEKRMLTDGACSQKFPYLLKVLNTEFKTSSFGFELGFNMYYIYYIFLWPCFCSPDLHTAALALVIYLSIPAADCRVSSPSCLLLLCDVPTELKTFSHVDLLV